LRHVLIRPDLRIGASYGIGKRALQSMDGLAHLSVLIVQPGHLAVVLAVGVLKVACELLVSPSLLFELFARGCLGTSAVYGLDAKGGYLGDT